MPHLPCDCHEGRLPEMALSDRSRSVRLLKPPLLPHDAGTDPVRRLLEASRSTRDCRPVAQLSGSAPVIVF